MASLVIVVLIGVVSSTACGSSGRATVPSRQHTALQGPLTVAAAASLTGVFGTLKSRFEAAHPRVRVAFDFASSGVLETQIEQGAPADVFASADAAVMNEARRAGSIDGTPVVFARNSLELVVRPGNPLGIRSLHDLSRARVVALCADRAPCGASAATILERAQVDLPTSKISRGQDVKATLQQVTLGDADAAIVYVTDARTVGDKAQAVPIPAAQDLVTDYSIAVVKGSARGTLARAWIAFVNGPNGRATLHAAGFALPS